MSAGLTNNEDASHNEEISYALDAAYAKGWEDSKTFYKQELLGYFDGSIISGVDISDIEDVFNEYPENEMDILRQAALNRGQP